ncbi:universal stress protein [Halegenticoccus tardaugens]|uniref:universal stress protein n=1 Tax=Halegenticoccus tardaugens TaxID=2071624 RepID=UPI00100A4BB4|nr:universal stress protein [Halegenticoccus tardaugens]
MQRALAVVDSDERSREMVHEAGELAAGVDAEVVILHVTTEEEFRENQDRLAEGSSGTSMYSVETAQEGARQYAANVGTELLGDVDVTITAVGALGEKREEILAAAREHDCDYVFITGANRSPTGKALFGDDAQSIILNFDGSVVVRTE